MKVRARLTFGILAIVLTIVVVACEISNSHSFVYYNEERSYEIYTPPSLDKRSGKNKPLLLVLHGNPSTGWQMRMYSGMNKVAKKGDFIVAYPNAFTGKWPISDNKSINAEVGYIDALIDDVVSRYPVDTTRIYTSGISGGGIFSFLLADRLPGRFAAIGVVAGNLPTCIEDPEGIQSMPLILFHGTDDFLYDGRPDLHSVDRTVGFFGRINNCESIPNILLLDNISDDGTTVELLEFRCPTSTRFYRIKNGGHHWPGGVFNASRFTKMELGTFCKDIDASQLIWDFVSEQSK